MTEYMTMVFYAPDRKSLSAITSNIMRSYPFMTDDVTGISAMGEGDSMSIMDAIRIVLECRDMSNDEKIDLIKELDGCQSWGQCKIKFSEWDLAFDDFGMLAQEGD